MMAHEDDRGRLRALTLGLILAAAVGGPAFAQTGNAVQPAPGPQPTQVAVQGVAQAPALSAAPSAPSGPAAPAPLVVYFEFGSSVVHGDNLAVLDQASRLYRDGKPIVMVVSGSTDGVGDPARNLTLSERRASAVLHGLVERGIPADRFQLLAKGETEPAVPERPGQAEAKNRRVEISWR